MASNDFMSGAGSLHRATERSRRSGARAALFWCVAIVAGLGAATGIQCKRRSGVLTQLKKLLNDEEGATAVEYGLMVAAISAVIVAIVVKLGGQVNTAFTKVSSTLP